MLCRPATAVDIPAMARLRSEGWETPEFWEPRIAHYLAGEHHPHKALAPRIAFVAEDSQVAGFIAGHLTTRHGCQGELQWINVAAPRRRQGIASLLLETLAAWFVEQNALRVCINVEPGNTPAQAFYRKRGARPLNPHWLVWELRNNETPEGPASH